MSSHQEEEQAGPSGLTTEEILTLLGLNTSDSEKEDTPSQCLEEELGDSDEDEVCQEALDRFEWQCAFQTQLLQQSGGGMGASAEGAFEFDFLTIMSID